MKFIDFFAGIGGFRSGLEHAGHECVGYIEWDKFARESYQAMYDTKGEYTAHDIQEVKGTELPEAGIWTFGSPCTNISVAGNQQGLKGEQSRMFFEIIRLLKERIENKKTLPAYLFMENVKNLLSSNSGRDFARVVFEMDQVGYDVEWSVINSADVVPQNRERVYIIGHFRGTCTRRVFPIKRQSPNSCEAIKVVNDCRAKDEDKQPKILVRAALTPDRINKRQNGRRFKENGEPSFTVTTEDRHGVLLDDGKNIQIRKFTPLECWRLQGFTDEQFHKAKSAGVSNSQLYKQAGNAVTVPVVAAIAERLVKK